MYLLDTNALIILMYGEVTDAKLSEEALKVLAETDELYLSVVSLWEIAIKIKIGKINIKNSIQNIVSKCEEENIKILPIKVEYMDETLRLPFNENHKDPFDRMILSTAISEDLTLISTDSKMNNYDVKIKY